MPKVTAATSFKELDKSVYRLIPDSNKIACLVCPKKKQVYPTFTRGQLVQHEKTAKHSRHAEIHHSLAVLTEASGPSISPSSDVPPVNANNPVSHSTQENQIGSETPFSPNTDSGIDPAAALSILTDVPVDDGVLHRVEDLWNANDYDRTVSVDNESNDSKLDYFEELLASKMRDGYQFPLLFTASAPEVSTEDDGTTNDEYFGIDLEGVASTAEQESRAKIRQPVPAMEPTYPWPSMPFFITSLLFSSPRLCFSTAQKKAILHWPRELRAPDVPTLYALEKCEVRIRKLLGDPTKKVVTGSGNVFYLNKIGDALRNDYSNPITRCAMQDYPEFKSTGMSEIWNGYKMNLDIPNELVTQTVRVDGQLFYVNELLQRSLGAYFIPERFFYRRQENNGEFIARDLVALGYDVERHSEKGFVVAEERTLTPVSTFERTFLDIKNNVAEFACGFSACSIAHASKMPNQWREKAGNRMVHSVPLIVFMDDVSGNISKQWNKHYVVYMSNANLPRKMLEKEFCVRFVTSSPHASPMELMKAVKDSIVEAASSGIVAWDCEHEEEIFLAPYGLSFAGDNPMQSEECSHASLNCNYFCRTCPVGGNKTHKASEEGFAEILKIPDNNESGLRTPSKTKAEIEKQLRLATESGGTTKVKDATTATGVRDAATSSVVHVLLELGKQLRKRTPGSSAIPEDEIKATLAHKLEECLDKEPINPLIGMPGVNIHLDTPTEILHTVLLGVVKYFWGQTVWLLNKSKQMETFHARLTSVNRHGMNAPNLDADYICKYSGGLIGKHFKSLSQVMPFLVYDIVPKHVLDAWNAIGELVVLLWHTEIEHTEEYLASLSKGIEDFLHLTAKCSPSILISKPKFHFLVHLPAYIRRFGPAIVFSTERYESFNHVFRLTCIYSNRKTPSRDTCKTFGGHDCIKHIVTGGFWFDDTAKKWMKAGSAITDYMENNPGQLSFIGLKPDAKREPGEVRLQANAIAVPWSETLAASTKQAPPGPPHPSVYRRAILFVACNDDTVCIDDCVIFTRARGNDMVAQLEDVTMGSTPDTLRSDPQTTRIGHVMEVLVPANLDPECEDTMARIVVVKMFCVFGSRHMALDLPCIDETDDYLIIGTKDVLCNVNVQHNCMTSHCQEHEQVRVQQENNETTKTYSVTAHVASRHYVLNAYSIHNYREIISVLPPDLRKPTPRNIDKDNIQKTAVQQLQQKKAAQETQPDGISIDAMQTEAPPVFDRPTRTGAQNKSCRQATNWKGKGTNRKPSQSQQSQDVSVGMHTGPGNVQASYAAGLSLSAHSVAVENSPSENTTGGCGQPVVHNANNFYSHAEAAAPVPAPSSLPASLSLAPQPHAYTPSQSYMVPQYHAAQYPPSTGSDIPYPATRSVVPAAHLAAYETGICSAPNSYMPHPAPLYHENSSARLLYASNNGFYWNANCYERPPSGKTVFGVIAEV